MSNRLCLIMKNGNWKVFAEACNPLLPRLITVNCFMSGYNAKSFALEGSKFNMNIFFSVNRNFSFS